METNTFEEKFEEMAKPKRKRRKVTENSAEQTDAVAIPAYEEVDDNITADAEVSTETVAETAKSEEVTVAEVKVSEQTAETKAEESCDLTGKPFTTELTLIYSSSVNPNHFSGISGTYYFWDSTIENNRIRVTDRLDGVGRPSRVLGWIELSETGGM